MFAIMILLLDLVITISDNSIDMKLLSRLQHNRRQMSFVSTKPRQATTDADLACLEIWMMVAMASLDCQLLLRHSPLHHRQQQQQPCDALLPPAALLLPAAPFLPLLPPPLPVSSWQQQPVSGI
jgi:hypothetical protein